MADYESFQTTGKEDVTECSIEDVFRDSQRPSIEHGVNAMSAEGNVEIIREFQPTAD